MGSEVSTVGGAIATAATSVAAGVCFGQVDALNDAVVHCAKFTGSNFMESNVRRVGECAGMAVAAAATMGQCDAVNEHLKKTSVAAGEKLLDTLSDTADAVPGVGHIKGTIHYACGDHTGGEKAMKAASRTIGVIGGGIAGIPLGPAGMVAGGVVGGAAMDGLITGVDSAVKHEYRPMGQVAAWTQLVQAKNPDGVLQGLVGVVAAPVMDGLGGYAAGKAAVNMQQARLQQQVTAFLEEGGNLDVMEALDAAGRMKPAGKYVPQQVQDEPRAARGQAEYQGREVPPEGRFQDGGEVYRGDHRLKNPDKLRQTFEEGIEPKGDFDDAFHHTRGNAEGTNFVSTSKQFRIAQEYGAGNRPNRGSLVLKIRARGGIDIHATAQALGASEWYTGQAEVAIHGGVRSCDIVGAIKFPAGGGQPVFHPNPAFLPVGDVFHVVKHAPTGTEVFAFPYVFSVDEEDAE